MKRKRILITSSAIIMVSLCVLVIFFLVNEFLMVPKDDDFVSASSLDDNSETKNFGNDTYTPPSDEYDDNNNIIEGANMNRRNNNPWKPATEIDLNPESVTVFVNREFNLPKDYVPKDLTMPNIRFDTLGLEDKKFMRAIAAVAIEDLFAAAEREGHILYGVSGYRSYSRQRTIFLNNIVKKGRSHTLKYSAVPGVSEHQTGLAMDVSTKGLNYRLVTRFATTAEGRWLADNAHYYGFIIRYGDNSLDITGYEYEPWHIRYVGRDLATYLYENDMTLEQYYNYEPSDDFDFEAEYASLINYKPPTPTPTPEPEEDDEEDDEADGEDDDEENEDEDEADGDDNDDDDEPDEDDDVSNDDENNTDDQDKEPEDDDEENDDDEPDEGDDEPDKGDDDQDEDVDEDDSLSDE